jgi:hypothetical protein
MASRRAGTALLLAALALAPAGRAAPADAPLPEPGLRIDRDNARRFSHLMPEFVLRWIVEGAWLGEEARVSLRVGPTRPAPLPASYLAATQRRAGGVMLRPDGMVTGWTAGLPFPEPAPPELAAKIVWNQYYRWRGDQYVIDSYRTLQTDRWGNRRETRGIFELLTLAGRTDGGGDPELPGNGRRLRTASRLIFTHPPQSRWQTTLFYRYLDPKRDDDVYVYLPSTRRVLRVQGGRRCVPVRGSDFTPDDFFGFDGRVWEHEWRVVHEGPALALAHQASLPTRLDARGAWPVDEAWEVRDVWVVEGVPKDGGYCYGRRRLWIDRFHVFYAEVWDPAGVFWKGFVSTWAHRPVETGESAPVWGGTGAYDFQSRHLTFVTIGRPQSGRGYRIGGSGLGPADFTPGALRRLGR